MYKPFVWGITMILSSNMETWRTGIKSQDLDKAILMEFPLWGRLIIK